MFVTLCVFIGYDISFGQARDVLGIFDHCLSPVGWDWQSKHILKRPILHRRSNIVGSIRESAELHYLLRAKFYFLNGEGAGMLRELGKDDCHILILGSDIGRTEYHSLGGGLLAIIALFPHGLFLGLWLSSLFIFDYLRSRDYFWYFNFRHFFRKGFGGWGDFFVWCGNHRDFRRSLFDYRGRFLGFLYRFYLFYWCRFLICGGSLSLHRLCIGLSNTLAI
jgi:hypothetical protein